MRSGLEVTRDSLRGDLRASIEAAEAALALEAPGPALECLSVEAILSFARLSFPVNGASLRHLLRRLRHLLDGRDSLPALEAQSLARLIVDLDPVTASFCNYAPWREAMEPVTKSDKFRFIGEVPISVAVRGADKASAERRIVWLLRQLGVPAGSRPEALSEATERRAA